MSQVALASEQASKRGFYATTPIFYVNAEPHIGHAYNAIFVDALTRFHRLRGEDAYFVTGTDEHGEKIHLAASAAEVPPEQFVGEMSAKWRDTWDQLAIEYDDFIRTTEDRHKTVVNEVLQRVYDNGDIFYGEYSGMYCVGCERYLTEKDLRDGKCPDHDVPVEYRTEANYFFRLERYRPWLQEHLESNPDFIRPERYRNEVLGMLRAPIGDLSISRPRSRVPWGIPLPWDSEHVTYVWFDALINYYSALSSRGLSERYWPHANHIIGKDIVKPHGIFWPIMLKAAGLPLFERLNVHGWWLTDQGKMSKTKGNVERPLGLREKYGTEAFRYFLLREMTFGLDATFSELALAERINSDLANDLGNLLHRTLSMLAKYRNGVVPVPGRPEGSDEELVSLFRHLPDEVGSHIDRLELDRAIESVMASVRRANKYIADTRPWTLAKDEAQSKRLDTVLYNCVEVLRCASTLLGPVLPQKARDVFLSLGLEKSAFDFRSAGRWNVTPPGTRTRLRDPLFPRVDLDALTKTFPAASDVVEGDHAKYLTVSDFSGWKALVGNVRGLVWDDIRNHFELTVDLPFGERRLLAEAEPDCAVSDWVGQWVALLLSDAGIEVRALGARSGVVVARAGTET